MTRRLPTSDPGRKRVLDKALAKNTSLPPAEKPLTPATEARLALFQPLFKNAMLARAAALSGQVGATAPEDASFVLGKMHISHFIQGFDNGIKRGTFVREHRAMYQLPVGSDAFPRLITEAEITEWAGNLHDGDLLRIADGGAPMSNPTIAEVDLATADFIAKSGAQSGKVTAYDNAQHAVELMRPEADAIIKKIYDESETFYNEEEPASMRRKCRLMGIVYVSDIKITFHLSVKDSVTHIGIPEPQAELVETGAIKTLSATGTADVQSTLSAEEATFEFTHPDYVTLQTTVILTDGVLEYTVEVEMVHV